MSGTHSPASQPSTDGIARHTAGRPHRRWFERLFLALGVIGVLVSLTAAGGLAFLRDKVGEIETVQIATVEKAEVGEPSNWLLVGSDSRENIDPNDPNAALFLGDEAPGGKRTDTIIIARVDPANKIIDLLSIPRDLYVPIADGGGEGRINSAFGGDSGEARLVNTIEEYFGFEINHYAEIDFVGFQSIVNALGGVPIWFDQPMRDFNSGLNVESAGCVVLDGNQALAFARSRHLEYFEDGAWRSDGTGDLGRTARQQHFVGRVAATATDLNITDLTTIASLLDAGGKNLIIDGGVSVGDLRDLAQTFSSATGDQVRGHALPVYDFRTSDNAAVLGLETELAQPVLDLFRGIAPVTAADPAAAAFDYRVLNGSGVAGQAATVQTALGLAGLEVAEVDNADPTTQTTIRYPAGGEAAAETLARHLVAVPAYELDESLTDVVLVTGSDFNGVRETPVEPGTIPAPPAGAPAPEQPAIPTVAAEDETPLVGVVPGPSPEGTACA